MSKLEMKRRKARNLGCHVFKMFGCWFVYNVNWSPFAQPDKCASKRHAINCAYHWSKPQRDRLLVTTTNCHGVITEHRRKGDYVIGYDATKDERL